MKKILLLLVIFQFFRFEMFSQEEGDFRMGIYGQAITMRTNVLPQYGLVGEYFVSHNFSLNYRYGFGYNSDGEVTAHINPSILSIALIPTFESLALSVMIPEGVSYHIYPKDFLEIAPYVNPLGSEINLYTRPSLVLSCSAGIAFHLKPVADLSIAPNFGLIMIYRNGEVMPNMGLSLNYNFE